MSGKSTGSESKKRKSPVRTAKDGPEVSGGSTDARRTAALVLEVMAGATKPTEAARLIGVSLPRYYLIEKRALKGLLFACEPLGPGRKSIDDKRDFDALKKKVTGLEQEVLRYQALARAAQRAIGLPEFRASGKDTDKRGRHRRPFIRALKIARHLKDVPGKAATPDTADKGALANATD